MIDLKPCPFCGGEAEIERVGNRKQLSVVVCTDCGCRVEGNENEDNTGSKWNMRENDDFNNSAAKTFKNSKNAKNPVLKDGELENFTIKVKGKNFRCVCDCNVFHKPDDTDLNKFQCNSCNAMYESE